MKNLPIFKLMRISTAHITSETDDYLMSVIDDNDFMLQLFHTGYGYLISVPYDDELDTEIPPDLKCCLEFARENDCAWLQLDSDGDVIDELKEYNWD